MSGRIVHFELPYDDAERARAFYGGIFGWDIQSYPGMEYSMVSTGPSGDTGPTEPGFINGGMAQRGEGFAGPTVVVDVDDIDATLAQIEQNGGAVLVAKRPVAEMGFTAYFTDPEGNVVGLWETKRSS
jgi:predicted enzyme related to lactoylglutathione lyase